MDNEGNELVYIKRNGGIVLLNNGYQYVKHKTYKNGSSLWLCCNRKKAKCTGNITISADTVLNKQHSCSQNRIKNDLDLHLNKYIQKGMESDELPIPTIYKNAVCSLKDSGLDLICNMPSFNSVKTRFYYNRNKASGVNKIVHKNPINVEVPLQYKKFLLAEYCDVQHGDRILLFASETARQFLNENTIEDYLCDGTFKSCAKPFCQIFVICGDLGSTVNATNIVPLIYALLPDKKLQTYQIVFELLKAIFLDWHPKTFKSDYEEAIMKAIKNTLPDVILKGCYYHFRKCIWKKGKELGLISEKINKRIISLCAVLPLLPLDSIKEGWEYIRQEAPQQCEAFIKYMQSFWFKNQSFIKIWTVFGENHRTTNFVEGWNHGLNNAIGSRNVNLLKLLKVLQDDAHYYTVHGMRVLNNCSPRKRQKKTILNDEFIQTCQMELTNAVITVGHFLEKVK